MSHRVIRECYRSPENIQEIQSAWVFGTHKEQIIESIYKGVDARLIKAESKYVADRLEELEAEESQNQDRPPPKPLVHPTMANRYRQEVEDLRKALNRENARAEASEHLRGLIGKIVLTPNRDERICASTCTAILPASCTSPARNKPGGFAPPGKPASKTLARFVERGPSPGTHTSK